MMLRKITIPMTMTTTSAGQVGGHGRRQCKDLVSCADRARCATTRSIALGIQGSKIIT